MSGIFKHKTSSNKNKYGYKFVQFFVFPLWLHACTQNSIINGCDDRSRHYANAKSLTEERLEKMYFDFKAYAENGIEFKSVNKADNKRPREFDDLEYARIKLIFWKFKPEIRVSRIKLQGCFDHDIALTFNGIDGNEKPSITLYWGEGPDSGSEKLWQQEE